MNEGEIGMCCLKTPQESVVPDSKIYIRLGYEGRGEGKGGKGVGVILRGIRHTLDRRLVC